MVVPTRVRLPAHRFAWFGQIAWKMRAEFVSGVRRFLRLHRVGGEAAVVERQGRHDRVLVDGGVADGGGGYGQSGLCGDDPAGFWRRGWPLCTIL